jgi:hypothetical protein
MKVTGHNKGILSYVKKDKTYTFRAIYTQTQEDPSGNKSLHPVAQISNIASVRIIIVFFIL